MTSLPTLARFVRERGNAIAYGVCLVIAFYYLTGTVAAFVTRAFVRIGEPSTLNWLEPIFYRSAYQAYLGEPLYPPPSAFYVPGQYTPLLDLWHGLLMHLFGLEYAPLRLSSFLAFCGLVGLLAWWVRRVTKSTVALGLFIALVPPSTVLVGGKFSTVNVDAPFLLLGFAGLAFTYFGGHRHRFAAVAGALTAMSFLTKPQGFVLAVAAFVFLALFHRRTVATYAAVCAGLAGVVSSVYLWVSDGWFWRSIVELSFNAPLKEELKLLVRMSRGGTWFATAALVGSVWIHLWLLSEREHRRSSAFFVIGWAAISYMAYKSFTNQGGGENSLYPALLYGLFLAVISVWHIVRMLPERSVGRGVVIGSLACAMLVNHLTIGHLRRIFDDIERAPTIADFRARNHGRYRAFERQIEQAIDSIDGRVFVGARPHLQVRRGLEPNAHVTSINNLATRTNITTLDDVFGTTIRNHEYAGILLWEFERKAVRKYLERHYRFSRMVGGDPTIGVRVSLWLPPSDEAPTEAVPEAPREIEPP